MAGQHNVTVAGEDSFLPADRRAETETSDQQNATVDRELRHSSLPADRQAETETADQQNVTVDRELRHS